MHLVSRWYWLFLWWTLIMSRKYLLGQYSSRLTMSRESLIYCFENSYEFAERFKYWILLRPDWWIISFKQIIVNTFLVIINLLPRSIEQSFGLSESFETVDATWSHRGIILQLNRARRVDWRSAFDLRRRPYLRSYTGKPTLKAVSGLLKWKRVSRE